MKLSLDTDVAIEILRGKHPHYRTFLEQAVAEGAELHLSAVVFHELMFGAMNSPRPKAHMEQVDAFVTGAQLQAWEPEDALATARLRADLQAGGEKLEGLDVLIAGHALNRQWTLVTNNFRHFNRVAGLPLLDWSDPSGPREHVR